MNNTCKVCQNVIQVMCRKNTGICSELCEKELKKARKRGRRRSNA